jgi:hypothetical protein
METNQETKSRAIYPTPEPYPARLQIDYPEKFSRIKSFFRIFTIIPIAIILGLIAGASEQVHYTTYVNQAGEVVRTSRDTTGGIAGGIFLALVLLIVFRQRYPRWWFDFSRELTRFASRFVAYLMLLTDQYPSTVEEQSVHLDIDYADAKNELNRWMPLIKWFLAVPHYIVLGFLAIGAIFAVLIAWFAILFTGRYPRSLFDYMVGVARWGLRVNAFAFLLVTDHYPPFSLQYVVCDVMFLV